MEKKINYLGREVPVLGNWETVVVGGGVAGSSAAIASAEGGCKTLVIEKSIQLGGTASNALVTPMMPSFTGHRSNFFKLEQRLNNLGYSTRDDIGTTMLWFSSEKLGTTIESIYVEVGGEILYDAVLTDCILEQKYIKYVLVTTVNGLCAIEGQQFIDASGDLVLARCAGALANNGDENGDNQMTSLRFEMGGIDIEKYRNYVVSLHDTYSKFSDGGYFYESAMVGGQNFVLEPIFQKGIDNGILKPEDLRYFQNFSIPGKPGCMSFNCPHLALLTNNTNALDRSKAITQGHEMIRRLVIFLKKFMPGFKKSYLIQIASMLGIRESYRLVGEYMLTEDDYTNQSRFVDGIARGDWYIDVHSATKGLVHQNTYQEGDYYEIPYRSMISNKINNLVVTGRCISTTFLMQASVRIIPTCIDMGQSAGEACVYAKSKRIDLNKIDGSRLKEQMSYSK